MLIGAGVAADIDAVGQAVGSAQSADTTKEAGSRWP
jgi:hypothetical protein